MAVNETGDVLSVDKMLANAEAAARRFGSQSGMSAVEKLLQGREEVDTVEISPVAKLLQAREQSQARKADSYKEEDWYIRAKVNQLRAQLQTYTNLPGLDPSGGIMAGIEAEIKELAQKQADKLKESTAETREKQERLAELERQKELEPMSVDDMLARTKSAVAGTPEDVPLSKDVQALLDKLNTDS